MRIDAMGGNAEANGLGATSAWGSSQPSEHWQQEEIGVICPLADGCTMRGEAQRVRMRMTGSRLLIECSCGYAQAFTCV